MGKRWPWGLAAWCVALVAGTAFFHGLGAEVLVSPPLEPAAWGGWVEERGPEVATVAVLRLVVLGLCWYLVGVTTIGLVVRLLRAAALIRAVDALTVPWVRRLLQQGLGVALATAMVANAAGVTPAEPARPAAAVAVGAAGALAPSSPAEVAAGTDGRTQGDGELAAGEVAAGEVAAGELAAGEVAAGEVAAGELAPAGQGLDALPIPVPFLAGGDTAGVDLPAVDPPAGSTTGGTAVAAEVAVEDGAASYVVRSGDSLWRIAERQLAGALHRAPADAEIVPYWRELIERNRAGLPDPDDPDLILPGQRLELPALPEG